MNYEITEEQIKELAKGNAKVKKWYPEVFETKIITGWFKTKTEYNKRYLMYFENGINKYGFNGVGNWKDEAQGATITTDEYLATDSEVLEALTNEAIKRGFKEGVCFTTPFSDCGEGNIFKSFLGLGDNKNTLWAYSTKDSANRRIIFKCGKWAEIIKTYTKEEAEKLLNGKIV